MTKLFLNGIVFMTVVALVSGCAATQQTSTAEPAGFLGDYSKLQKGEEGQAQLRYINQRATWDAYKKVIVDPVTIWLGKDGQLKEIEPEDRQRLANDLWTKIGDALKQDYEIVHEAGPDVLRIQAAITEAESSNPVMDTISSIHPGSKILSGGVGMARGGQPSFAGEASLEAKITDAKSGALLAAIVDQRAGTKSISGSTNSWHDVEASYQYWANTLRYRLCKLRGGGNCVEPEA